jgi:hypothetical protein
LSFPIFASRSSAWVLIFLQRLIKLTAFQTDQSESSRKNIRPFGLILIINISGALSRLAYLARLACAYYNTDRYHICAEYQTTAKHHRCFAMLVLVARNLMEHYQIEKQGWENAAQWIESYSYIARQRGAD